MTIPATIMEFIGSRRWPLSDEKRLQQEIEEEFQRAGIIYSREYRLSDRDIIDFIVGDTGIEIKIKGPKLNIYRQLERYAEHGDIKCLVLVTNVAMGLPDLVKGKPLHLVNLARAWL